MWAVCYPAVSLIVGLILTVVWILRSLLKAAGKMLFYVQRLAGGAPEAVDVNYIGPATGKIPETSELRQFKPTGSAERMVAVKRNGSVAVFKVGTDVPSIRSHGIYLPVDVDTIRGSADLVSALKGHDRVHLCRNEVCPETGGHHFCLYGVVKALNPERFQLAQAEEGAREAGRTVWGWMSGSGARVQKLATKVRELASESECEDDTLPCHAGLVGWEDDGGGARLAESPCTVRGSEFSMLLQEDVPVGISRLGLCQQHAAQYLKTRYLQKCSYGDCSHVGFDCKGLRLCTSHQHLTEPAKKPTEKSVRTTSSTRRSRSRSRSRPTEDADEAEEVEVIDGDEEMIPAPENEIPRERARRILREAAEEEYQTPKPRRTTVSRSPGHTPKSNIHRNLARLGMLDSPDGGDDRSVLQEFCESLAETKPLGWTEARVRDALCSRLVKTPEELLRQLIMEAEIEQARGQRGLTKFLTRWRQEQQRLEELHSRKGDSEWSVIGPSHRTTPNTSPEQPEVPAFPPPPPGLGERQVDERSGVGVRIGAPTVYKADRKAGAGEDAGGREPMTQIARAIQHQTAELASLVKQQSEVVNHAAGSMKGLGKQAEEVVFLMRACGQYDVQLGQGEHGQALANTLLAAQVGASTKLRNAGFRQKMTGRLAVGLAGGYWGTHEKYCLSVADFLTYTDAELDAFASETKGAKGTDQRPAGPQRLDDWLARTKRQTDTWCLVYGSEWRDVRNNAMEALAAWHLAQPHKWPLNVVMDIWEELHWRVGEEFKELLRQLKKFANRETMTLTELKFHALLPGAEGEAWLVMPNTFDIERPGSWFQEEVLPRIERKQERLLWNLTWQGGARKVTPQPAGGGAAAAGGGDSEQKPTVKTLWGPKLTAEETSRAKERAPLDRNGTLLCWGNLSRMGCEVQGCQRSHENLRGAFEALDPCVQMQLLRRGGLKRMKAETKETVTSKIKDLRALMAKDKGDKIGDGKKKALRAGTGGESEAAGEEGRAGGADDRGDRRVQFDVPEEFNVDYTEAEDLKELVKGPSERWAEDVYQPVHTHGGRNGTSAPEEARRLVAQAQELASSTTLKSLEGASDDLYAWAASRVARQPTVELVDLMTEMATYGMGELAREATEYLEVSKDPTKAGETSRLTVRDTLWVENQPGQGAILLDGKTWRLWDYGEDVEMTEDLAGLLKLSQPELEKRQCVTMTMAAAIEWRSKGRRPQMSEVHARAQEVRIAQTRLAKEAEEVVGQAEEMVAPIEHELRIYIHDLVTPAHEKDFRGLAVFPVEELQEARVVVLRADYRGGLVVEVVQGQRWEPGGWDVVVLIWKGHMTLLQPPDGFDVQALLDKEEHASTPSLGFTFFWHTRHDQPRSAPGRLTCRLCKPTRRAGEFCDAYIRQHSYLSQAATTAGGASGLAVVRLLRPARGNGKLTLQELFAGHAGISKEWQASGHALEPVELYQDPHHRQGRRPEHDLADPGVQQRHLAALREPEGPNVGWIAAPCTSYCDWQLQNGGSRTFDNPEGTGEGPLAASEALGNTLSRYGAQYFEGMLNAGGFPVAESSAPSGRYPKQWDLPEWKRILSREDVTWVDFPMCAFRLGPPDNENEFYVHRTRVVFPAHRPLEVFLQRPCPGVGPRHRHVPLKGSRDGSQVTRCTEAGAYARDFVTGIVGILQATLVGGGSVFPTTAEEQAQLEKLPCTRGPDGGDCGCCQACCQGQQKCGRCTRCWALGVGHRPTYVKKEEAVRISSGTRAAGRGEGRSRSRERQRSCEESPRDEEGHLDEAAEAESRGEGDRAEDEEVERDERGLAGGENLGGEGEPPPGSPCEGVGEGPDRSSIPEPTEKDLRMTENEEMKVGGTDGADSDLVESGTPVDLGFEEEGEGEESEGGEDDESVEPRDYWERQGNLLIRRHVSQRTHLFDPQDMVMGFPMRDWQLGHVRRSRIMTLGGSVAVVDDEWRVHRGIHPGYGLWTGSTTFTVGRAADELHQAEDDQEGEEEDPEGGESEEYEPSTPGAEGEGGNPPQTGGERRAGSMERSGEGGGEEPEPEMKNYEAPSTEAKTIAEKYVECVQAGFANQVEDWKQLVGIGNELLTQAGTVEGAAKSLWQVREEKGLANLSGVKSERLDQVLHPDLLAYLRDVRKKGMAARFQGQRTRVKTRLHPNARKNLDQVYKQIAKDVGRHRVLLVGSDHPGLCHTVCSPFETVAKMLPDRTISTEQRLVHDQRGINAGTSKYLHPPAVQPSHAQIARRVLWHRVRCPNTPILMAKKDIAGAFRLLWVDPSDVELFGGDLPWKPEAFNLEAWETDEGCGQGITVLYLVSSFGFSGSPGEWTAWGRATEEFHRGFRPERSRRDLSVGFDSKVLVDDCVLVEPLVGLRPWVSAEVFEDGVRTMLGDAAINEEKDKIEGEFRTTQTVWGVIMDTQAEKAYLPEKRIQKGAALVATNEFDYGEKTVTLKQMQQFRGIMTGWSSVVQGLKNELKAADRFLGGKDGRMIVAPKLHNDGSEKWEVEMAWQELWELFEVCRWLSGRSDVFGTSLKEMLAPMERLSLPGEWNKVMVVSSDATPTYVGAIDWTNKRVFRQSMAELKPWIERVLNDQEVRDENFEEVAIHVAEMLSFVAFACEVGSLWAGSVVIYGGDNTVVKQWLETRRSGVRAGRLLIRVVNMVEARYGCTILAGWWRTYHNVDADFITRCTDVEFEEYVINKGWKVVDVGQAVRQALEDTERFGPCFLSWADPGDRVELMQLKERRMLRQLQKELVIPWENYAVIEWTQVGRRIRDFEEVAMRLGATNKGEAHGRPVIVCASLSMDPYGKHLQRCLKEVKEQGAWAAVVEGPRAVAWELGEKRCSLEGWLDRVRHVRDE